MFPLPNALNGAIVVTALISYGFGFGLESGSAASWPVRFAVLAGLTSGFLLLQRKSQPVLVAVLAAAGFTDSITVAVTGAGGGLFWGVLAANGIQTVIALIALMLARDAAPTESADPYTAYMEYYNEATRRYYDQQAAYAADTERQAAYAQAPAQAGAPSRARAAAQFPGYADFTQPQAPASEPRHSRPAASSGTTPPAGLPTSDHLAATAPPWHVADRPQRAPGD